jgi:hypothetical protein
MRSINSRRYEIVISDVTSAETITQRVPIRASSYRVASGWAHGYIEAMRTAGWTVRCDYEGRWIVCPPDRSVIVDVWVRREAERAQHEHQD